MSMTKQELIKIIADNAGITQAAANQAVDILKDALVEEVKATGRFALDGIGVFTKVERAARPGRNPKTGEAIMIPGKVAVKFRPSVSFKETVNG